MPSGCFGRASRDAAGKAEDRQKIAPAPVAYTLPDSVGRQPHSMKETLPSISFTQIKASRRRGGAQVRRDNLPRPGVSGGQRDREADPERKYSASPTFPQGLRSTDMTKKNPDEGALGVRSRVPERTRCNRLVGRRVAPRHAPRGMRSRHVLQEQAAGEPRKITGEGYPRRRAPGPAAGTLPGVGRQRLSDALTLPTVASRRARDSERGEASWTCPAPGAYRV